MDDPFLIEEECYNRLRLDYIKHGRLVIAIDFDNTIFDLHKRGYEFPQTIKLLQDCQKLGFYLVIFSASPQERWPDIFTRCVEIGIDIKGINCDVVDWLDARMLKKFDYSKSKIFYNILLCDRAGLPSAYRILKQLVDEIIKDRE